VSEFQTNVSAQRRAEVEDLFGRIDTLDPAALAPEMTDDAEFTFGNRPAMVGKEEIRAGNAHFFELIGGMSHSVAGIWEFGATTIVRADTTYTRLDGERVTIPTMTHCERRDGKIARWQVFFDVAPLFA
jgi:ketosteroid isomerase-like protein